MSSTQCYSNFANSTGEEMRPLEEMPEMGDNTRNVWL